jgi:hypothetical protein
MSHERVVTRAYSALTWLYPRRFRNEYGTDMVSLFREQCQDEPAWRVLTRTALDLAITIPTQHLEAKMPRTPSPLVALIYLAIAVAGLLLAVVGGSNAATAIIGLAIALVAGTVGAAAWRRATPVRETTVTGHWWKFLVAGPCLIALVIIAAGIGAEAWYLGIVSVLTGFTLIVIGLVLGASHLVNHRIRRIPTGSSVTTVGSKPDSVQCVDSNATIQHK